MLCSLFHHSNTRIFILNSFLGLDACISFLFLFCIPELCANPSSKGLCQIKKDQSCRGQRFLIRYSYSLRDGRSGDRIPVGTRFSAPVQTGSEIHPACHTMGTGTSPGVKRPGRSVEHPPPSSAEVKERIGLLCIVLLPCAYFCYLM